MLKELYETIVDQAKASVDPKLLELPGGEVLLVDGLTTRVIKKDPVKPSDKVASISSLLDWCSKRSNEPIVVTVQGSCIVVRANREVKHLASDATFTYQQTRAYEDLQQWISRPRSQGQVVNALRTTLAGTCDAKILSVFKTLDFRRKSDGSRTVGHAGESLGRSVEALAQSSHGDIPETIVFSMNLYGNVPSSPCLIEVAVDVDVSNEIIQIQPVGDSLVDARRMVIKDLVERMKEELPDALVLEAI